MNGTIHLWRGLLPGNTRMIAKCGMVVQGRLNILYASTAESLKIPPDRVCKKCYRLGPPWLVAVK